MNNVRKFYDDDAHQYDNRWTTQGGSINHLIQKKIVTDLLVDWSEDKVLEIGAGTGRLSQNVMRCSKNFFVSDLSKEMLQMTKERIKGQANNFYLTESSIYSLPYKDSVFDAIFTVNVLNHIQDIDRALSEMTRVLKTGGGFLLSFHNLSSYYYPAAILLNRNNRAYKKDVYTVWRPYRGFLDKLCEIGLQINQIRGNVYIPIWLDYPVLRTILTIIDKFSRYGPLVKFSPTIFISGIKK